MVRPRRLRDRSGDARQVDRRGAVRPTVGRSILVPVPSVQEALDIYHVSSYLVLVGRCGYLPARYLTSCIDSLEIEPRQRDSAATCRPDPGKWPVTQNTTALNFEFS